MTEIKASIPRSQTSIGGIRKPCTEYKRPVVEDLGTVEATTSGPANGSIDVLFGSNGGFQSTS